MGSSLPLYVLPSALPPGSSTEFYLRPRELLEHENLLVEISSPWQLRNGSEYDPQEPKNEEPTRREKESLEGEIPGIQHSL